MLRILLVDDDTINRVALTTMIDWEDIGFKITAVADNGKAALDILEKESFEVIITDMKMPIMDGLTLIREIRKTNNGICIVALSSYNDFDLVREAFKSNVEDYILKGNINSLYLTNFMLELKNKLKDIFEPIETPTSKYLEEYISGINDGKEININSYYISCIKVNNYQEVKKRFSTHEEDFLNNIKLILEQMPSIGDKIYIFNLTRDTIGTCLCLDNISCIHLETILKQIIQVLKDYMNIDVSISASNWSNDKTKLLDNVDIAINRLTLQNIYGLRNLFTKDHILEINIDDLKQNKYRYNDILKSFKDLDEKDLSKYQRELFCDDTFVDINEVKKRCLELIYFEGEFLEEMGISIWNIWGKRINFPDKLDKLNEPSRVMIWISNYNRFIMEYLRNNYKDDIIISASRSAKHYIQDNYMNPNLDLAEVASISNLNPYYFSSKFKKDTGSSFKEYLTKLRISTAENLLKTTNMKLSEISIQVGYNNVEHFIRVFKKQKGVSPREFSKDSNI